MAEAVARGVLAGGVAVIPAGAVTLAGEFRGAGLQAIENPDAASGVASSLRAGLAALEAARDPVAGAALIVLADQPLLRVAVIGQLVAEWRASGRSVRPRYGAAPDAPGHPVLVERGRWPLARTLAGDQGLGALLQAGPDPVTELDVPGSNPDVDTAADLSALEDRPA